MAATIDFADHAKQSMSALRLEPLDLDPQLARIEADGGTIDLEPFKADKLEKVVFCTIRMHETGVVESTAMAWPDDDHNLPILWCNLTIVPEVMNVPIFDFVPMMDIVVWPEYAERYIAVVSALRDNALEILLETVTDKAVNLPSLSVYALSPYRLIAKVTDDGIKKIPEVLKAYISEYIKLWEKASKLDNGPEKQFYLKKKAATRKLMKANDPGYAFMIDVFGEEKTKKVFDIVF
jgi:hypothetical protein